MTPADRIGATDAERRARRREVARRHHPDLGGDAEEFVRSMDELDATDARVRMTQPTRSGARTATNTVVTTTARTRAVRRLATARRRLARRIRSRIPRSLPGSRRYGHL